jgi:hypothetical protein
MSRGSGRDARADRRRGPERDGRSRWKANRGLRWLLLGSVVTLVSPSLFLQGRDFPQGPQPRPSDFFAGEAIPVPPRQSEPWEPPGGGLQESLVSATRVLFEQGLADPRGCEYREVRFIVGSVWGHHGIETTHGWVLPESSGTPGSFAVAWNGLVYPLQGIGGAADLEGDIRALLEADRTLRKKAEAEGMRFSRGLEAWNEKTSTSFSEILPIKACLLLRVGRTDLARDLWEAWIEGHPNEDYARDPYLRLAHDWAWALYDRLHCAHQRGEDRLALLDARALGPIGKAIDEQADRRGFRRPDWLHPKEGKRSLYLTFLENSPRLLADLERRGTEGPRPAALATPENVPDPASRIAILIRSLEDAMARQTGQPGGVNLRDAEVVQALVREGTAAVGPLLDCLETDDRLTRSVEFFRDFHDSRNVLSVSEAAYAALQGIFRTRSFSGDKQAFQDIREINSGTEGRRAVAARIREYRRKFEGESDAERWFGVLVDDAASVDAWTEAVENIVRKEGEYDPWTDRPGSFRPQPEETREPTMRGESLRSRKDPSLSELLTRRLRDIVLDEEKRKGCGYYSDVHFPQAERFARSMVAWDPKAHVADLAWLTPLMAEAENPMGRIRPVLAELYSRRIDLGDEGALGEYLKWIGKLAPVDRDKGGARVFHLLCVHGDDPRAREVADRLFGEADSAWRSRVLELSASPLLVFPTFRRAVAAALRDKTPRGEVVFRNGRVEVTRKGEKRQSQMSTTELGALAPEEGVRREFRTCDECVWKLRAILGFPDAHLYYPTAELDRAIASALDLLERYGERLRYRKELLGPRIELEPLGRPATDEDVRRGLAVFSLEGEGERRVVEGLDLPVNVRWTKAIRGGQPWPRSVWQAEEVFHDGKWVRYYGLIDKGYLGPVPAEEIEFLEPPPPKR